MSLASGRRDESEYMQEPPRPAPSPNFPSPLALSPHPPATPSRGTKRPCEGFHSLNGTPGSSCFQSVHPELRLLCLLQPGWSFPVHLCSVWVEFLWLSSGRTQPAGVPGGNRSTYLGVVWYVSNRQRVSFPVNCKTCQILHFSLREGLGFHGGVGVGGGGG